MSFKIIVSLFALLLSLSSAAMNSYMLVRSAKSGPIKGSVIVKGLEGAIKIDRVDHQLSRAYMSGQIVTATHRSPFRIIKEVDKSTPLLYNMLCSGESGDVVIKFFSNPVGQNGPSLTNDYTITLVGVHITSIKSTVPANTVGSTFMKRTETIEFIYKSVEWMWVDESITAKDVSM